MNKVFFLTIGLLLVVCYVQAQTTWGIRAGLNVSTCNMEYEAADGITIDGNGNSKAGFRLGIVVDPNLEKKFNVMPGLYFSMLGGKVKNEGEGQKYTEKDNLYYLQLPVLARMNLNIGRGNKWQIFLGPYVGCGIGGKAKLEQNGQTVKIDVFKKVEGMIVDNGGMLKRFDAGLVFGFGVLIKQFSAGVHYEFGLANIANKEVMGEEYKIHNQNFALQVGLNF